MTNRRKKLKPSLKSQLIKEAGNKCANPGCSNWRVHIHHIEHWAVYQSDEPEILIAVCPSCHDAIHHGSIVFTNDLLLRWKSIARAEKPTSTHVYIEPSNQIKLLTGTIALATKNIGVTIFDFSKSNQLSFKVLDGDIALLNIEISDLEGNEKLKVVDNHVKVLDTDTLSFEQVPGHIRVSTKDTDTFILNSFIEKMRIQEPEYLKDDNLLLLELEVIKPGHVKVKGCWADKDKAVIITDKFFSFITHTSHQPLSMVGEGENSVLVWVGAIDNTLFDF